MIHFLCFQLLLQVIANDNVHDYHNINVTNQYYYFQNYDKLHLHYPLLEKYFKIKNVLIWDKGNGNAGDLFCSYRTTTELIIFGMKGRKQLNKIGEKTRYTPYIKIRDFYSNVMTFLNEYGGYSDTLDYYGGYTEMMSQLFNDGTYEQIDFRVYDYPDSSEVNLQINDLFGDYLY